MKILWITNILFAHHKTMMGLDASQVTGGTWLNAAYEASLAEPSLELHIATIGDVPSTRSAKKLGNTFYILPGISSRDYDISSPANLEAWKNLIERVKPDAAIVWGTETRFAYVAMKALKDVPTAIYMQGVIGSICEHYYEGVPEKYKMRTLRDLIDKHNSKSQYNMFMSQRVLENEMFKMADAVIVENDWCEDMCRNINPALKVFRNMLPIREGFYAKKWDSAKIEKHSIFTNAGGYPIKGHHILFKALAIVKKRFPDFKCYIPGEKLSTFDSIKRRTGYMMYLSKLIKDNGLQDNIVYTGRVSSEGMADLIARCNIYVMPSIVENHSSSLIEAMIVGAPSISSLVGGTASLIVHKENGILYNSLDAESLAGNIIRLFDDDELTESIAKNSLEIRLARKQDFGKEMNKVYSSLMDVR